MCRTQEMCLTYRRFSAHLCTPFRRHAATLNTHFNKVFTHRLGIKNIPISGHFAGEDSRTIPSYPQVLSTDSAAFLAGYPQSYPQPVLTCGIRTLSVRYDRKFRPRCSFSRVSVVRDAIDRRHRLGRTLVHICAMRTRAEGMTL